MRRLQLTPVAAPTDPFVRPGLPGPKIDTANWEAIRALSPTLQQFGDQLEDVEDMKANRAERDITPEVAALVPSQLQTVLNSDDELTAEHLAQLKAAGIQGIDNPYAILALKRASAVHQVRQQNLRGWLTEPAFFNQSARLAVHSPEQADALLQQRVEQFMQEKIGSLGAQGSAAAAREAYNEMFRFRQARDDARHKVFAEETERAAALTLQPFAERFLASLYNVGSPELMAASVESAKVAMTAWIDEQRKLGVDTDAVLAGAIESTLRGQIDAHGGDVLHVLDALRDSFGQGRMAGVFDDLENRLERAVDLGKRRGYENVGKATAVVQSRIERAIAEMPADMTDKELREWIFQGDGNLMILQVADEQGVDPDLLGDIRSDILRANRDQRQTDRSDPEALFRVDRMIQDGKVDEAEVLLSTLSPSDVTWRDRLALREQITAERGKVTNDPDVKRARSEGFGAAVRALGDLSDEASAFAFGAQSAYDEAFNAKIKENPEDREAAVRAGVTALKASPEWKQIEELRKQDSFAFIASTNDYQTDVLGQLEETRRYELQQLLERRDQEGAEGTVDQRALQARWSKIKTRFNAFMAAEYDRLRLSPEVTKLRTQAERNRAIMLGLSAYSPEALERAEGLVPGPKTPEDAKEIAAINSDTQMAGFELRQAPRPAEIAQPGLTDDGVFIDGYYTSTMLGLQEMLAGSQNVRSLQVLPQTTELEVALSAQVVDGYRSSNPSGSRYDYASNHALKGAGGRKALMAVLLARGLLPEEVIAGKTRYGVPLDKVFGDGNRSWVTSFPLRHVAIYATKEEAEAAQQEVLKDPEKSKGARWMRTLGLDPTKSAVVNKVFEWQIEAINRRNPWGNERVFLGGLDPGTPFIPSAAIIKARALPKVGSDAPAWAHRRLKVAAEFYKQE